jgi:hypothetical protein
MVLPPGINFEGVPNPGVPIPTPIVYQQPADINV